MVQAVLFHPTKPLFFVATQRYVRMYNLAKQEMVKKLMPGVKYVTVLCSHFKLIAFFIIIIIIFFNFFYVFFRLVSTYLLH